MTARVVFQAPFCSSFRTVIRNPARVAAVIALWCAVTAASAAGFTFAALGDAPYYEPARYGEFRVAPDGEALLTALRGPNREVLGRGE